MGLLNRLTGSTGSASDRPSPRLDGRTVVVCGGAGEVGAGLTAGLLKSGARVAVPSRSPDRLGALTRELDAAGIPTAALVPIVGDLSGASASGGADAVAAEITARAGMPDLVVVALGGWDMGPPLADMEISSWDATVADGLRSHQLAASAFIPLLRRRPGASYVMINGAAGRYPVAGSGAVSVIAAGELMAAQVLGVEESGNGIQVEAYMLGPIATRSRTDAALWMATATQIGETIALRAGRRLDAQQTDAAPTTVIEILTRHDLGRARTLPEGGLRAASAGTAGWVMWGLQSGSIKRQVRRGGQPPPQP